MPSNESVFGDDFFEMPAKLCRGGHVAPSAGVDIAIGTNKFYKAAAIKSGPNIFNASQAKRMNDEFYVALGKLCHLWLRFVFNMEARVADIAPNPKRADVREVSHD